jgi:hypothetical protein
LEKHTGYPFAVREMMIDAKAIRLMDDNKIMNRKMNKNLGFERTTFIHVKYL